MNANLNHVTQAIRSGENQRRRARAPQSQPVTIEHELPQQETDTEHELCYGQPGPVRNAITALLATDHPDALERATRLAEFQRMQQEAKESVPPVIDFANFTPEEVARLETELASYRGKIEPVFTPAETTIDRDALVAICRLVTDFIGKEHPEAEPVTFDNVVAHVGDLIGGYEYSAETAAKTLAENRALEDRLKNAQAAQVAEYSIPLSVLREQAAAWIGIENTAGPEYPMDAIDGLITKLKTRLEAAEANQRPEGYEDAVKLLVTTQERYANLIAAIENVLKLK